MKIGDRVLVYSGNPDAHYGICEGVIVGASAADDEWMVAMPRTMTIDWRAAHMLRPLPLGKVRHVGLDGILWMSVAQLTYDDVERALHAIYADIDGLRNGAQALSESCRIVAIPQGKRWALAIVVIESGSLKRAYLLGWSSTKPTADAARAMVRGVLTNR